ncbi:HAD family phosphatase [Corynebacterium sp. TAE3-ERU30]|uniref:HAD family hydrolase n=1 Tax=Corynebacterium sp. TAE3-ERU30 TaxID=2849496 RepID=UPI001C484353|nr:HAD family hydrolase [Corynebacterium sp. TAE3-ERU30]MBV7282429.1 HAD-IB family hydrolase [Corynebacterium sp. TAE3-ERU30]
MASEQHPEAPVAAFFDLDKTIIATSSAFAFSRTLVSHGMLSTKEALTLVLAETGYMIAGHSQSQMDDTKDQLTQMVKGLRIEDLQHTIDHTLLHRVVPTIFAEARELIEEHHARGHDVIIISASVKELVDPIAHELGADHTITTRLEVVDGAYTGKLELYCRGITKATEISKVAGSHGYDLARCYAYSDSATDIPMLEMVGHPRAVNPDRVLKKHALAAEWPVLNFKNPVPLLSSPSKKDLGIGGAVAAALALGMGSWWLSTRWGALRSS